jgi:hypothetical protein
MQVPQMSGAIFAIAEGGDTADLIDQWGEPRLYARRGASQTREPVRHN